jgi:hypothetical protein
MAKFLGVDLPKIIKNALGPLVAPLTLVKVTATTPTAGQLTGGDNPTRTSYRAKGFFDDMPTRFPANRVKLPGTEVAKQEAIIVILGGYLPAGVEPTTADEIIMKGQVWRIQPIGTDPAYSVGQSAAYRCLVRRVGAYVAPVVDVVVGPVPTVSAVGTQVSGTIDQTPVPPAHAAGDKLILQVEWSGATPVPAPSGWTQMANSPQSQATNVSMALYYRDAVDGATPTPTVAISGNNHITCRIYTVNGAALGAPEATAGSTSGASGVTICSWPSVTTLDVRRLVLCFGAWSIDDVGPLCSTFANVTLTSAAEVADQGSTQGDGGGLFLFSGTMDAAGSVGISTCLTDFATLWSSITVALEPAP